jgi:hypothetical protein
MASDRNTCFSNLLERIASLRKLKRELLKSGFECACGHSSEDLFEAAAIEPEFG